MWLSGTRPVALVRLSFLLVAGAGCDFDLDVELTEYFPCQDGTCPFGDCVCFEGSVCVPADGQGGPETCFPQCTLDESCELDGDCDDQDVCTLDQCLFGCCAYLPLSEPVDCLISIAGESAEPAALRAYPGQQHLPVWLKLQNQTPEPVVLESVRLIMQAGQETEPIASIVQSEPGLPLELAVGERLGLDVRFDLAADLPPGTYALKLSLFARLLDGQQARPAGERDAGQLQVIVPSQVISVTTADDENDLGDQASLEAAGGPADVSLREALLLANAGQGPCLIVFDASIFPLDTGPVSISLAAGLGLLPDITRAGLWLDGQGASVLINGQALATPGAGLVIAADDVVVRGLGIVNFQQMDMACLVSKGVRRSQVFDARLENCGGRISPADEALHIQGGGDHRLFNLDVTTSMTGISFSDQPTDVWLANSRISGSDQSCLMLGGEACRLDSVVCQEGGHDLAAAQMLDRSTLADCRFAGSRLRSGLVLDGCEQVRLERCDFRDNSLQGLVLTGRSSQVTVSQASFSGNGQEPILLEAGTNADVQPPDISSFDGRELSGVAAAGGRIEIYADDDNLAYLAGVEVDMGDYSLLLPRAVSTIRATFTDEAGNTSAFGPPSISQVELIVSTTDDELDGGGNIVSVTQAGGPDDLSLREALVIANNHLGPDVITFSSQVFPPDSPATIALGPEPLPVLTDAGTVLSGQGAGVILDGEAIGSIEPPGLITIEADDCLVQGVQLAKHTLAGGAGVLVHGAARTRVADCRITNCGQGDGGGVVLDADASGALVERNQITGGSRSIYLVRTDNCTIRHNLLSAANGTCLYDALPTNNSYLDNHVHLCGQHGIAVASIYKDRGPAVAIGNIIHDVALGVGIQVKPMKAIQLIHNSAVDCLGGIQIEGVPAATARNNLLVGNTEFGLNISGATGLVEDHNLFFDNAGDGVSVEHAILGDDVTIAPHATDVLADPQLVDPAQGDLTPQAAAIDAGLDLGYDRNGDLPGNFNGLGPDIGAVEAP